MVYTNKINNVPQYTFCITRTHIFGGLSIYYHGSSCKYHIFVRTGQKYIENIIEIKLYITCCKDLVYIGSIH